MNIGNWLELALAIWALIVVPRGIWRAWTRPRPDEQPAVVNLAERRQPSGWSVRGELARLFLVSDGPDDMSSTGARSGAEVAGVRQVSHQVPERVSVSAKPNTDDTEPVPGAAGAGTLDADARAIIRASLIAEFLDTGLLTNRDKAIMQAFHCSKAASTRPDAPFQVALRLVEQHRAKARPEYIGEMRERIEREVAEQH